MMDEVYKKLDKFEVIILRCFPIPLTSYVIGYDESFIKHYNELKEILPKELGNDFIVNTSEIPFLPFLIIDSEEAIDKLDRLRIKLATMNKKQSQQL